MTPRRPDLEPDPPSGSWRLAPFGRAPRCIDCRRPHSGDGPDPARCGCTETNPETREEYVMSTTAPRLPATATKAPTTTADWGARALRLADALSWAGEHEIHAYAPTLSGYCDDLGHRNAIEINVRFGDFPRLCQLLDADAVALKRAAPGHSYDCLGVADPERGILWRTAVEARRCKADGPEIIRLEDYLASLPIVVAPEGP